MQFENSKILSYFFLLTLCLIKTSHQNFQCNQDLLLSYGLQGFENSQQIKFEMCPFIEYNCCRNEDQMKIFQNWIIDGEAENLNKRFDFYLNVYTKLIEQLEEVSLIAMDMDGILNKVRVSNCKIMAFRIQQFDIKKVGKTFLENLNKMFVFYQNSVKGFYCSLCDGAQQTYYNKHNQEIIISNKFGREFLDLALSPLLYIHLYFVHLLNITSRFTQNCDINGQYEDQQISRDFRFGMNPKTLFMLNNCRNNRNVPAWLNYCKDVVAKFHPTRIEKFLTGNIRKMNNYVLFLKENIKKYRDAQKLQTEKSKTQKQTKRKLLKSERILQSTTNQQQQANQASASQAQNAQQTTQDKTQSNQKETTNQDPNKAQSQKTEQKKDDPKKAIIIEDDSALIDKFLTEAEEFENFYEDEEIIQPALNSVYSVEDFKIVVQDNGINYLNIGKQTIIDDKVIMMIRNNNKQQIVAQEKKLEEEQQKLEEIKNSKNKPQATQPAQAQTNQQPTPQPQPQTTQQTEDKKAQTPPADATKQNGYRILEFNTNKRVL